MSSSPSGCDFVTSLIKVSRAHSGLFMCPVARIWVVCVHLCFVWHLIWVGGFKRGGGGGELSCLIMCLMKARPACRRPSGPVVLKSAVQAGQALDGVMNEMKAEIFARRAMVDQARKGLCYQRETDHFGVLDIEKTTCSDLS